MSGGLKARDIVAVVELSLEWLFYCDIVVSQELLKILGITASASIK